MGNSDYTRPEQSSPQADILLRLADRFVTEYLYQTQPLTTPESAREMLKEYAKNFGNLLASYPSSMRSQVEVYLNRLATLPLMIEKGEERFKSSLKEVGKLVLSVHDCFPNNGRHLATANRESFLKGLEGRVSEQNAHLCRIDEASGK